MPGKKKEETIEEVKDTVQTEEPKPKRRGRKPAAEKAAEAAVPVADAPTVKEPRRRRKAEPAQEVKTETESEPKAERKTRRTPKQAEADSTPAAPVNEPAARPEHAKKPQQRSKTPGSRRRVRTPEPAAAPVEHLPVPETVSVEEPVPQEPTAAPVAETAAQQPTEQQPDPVNGENGHYKHAHPKFSFNFLASQTISDLRRIARDDLNIESITARRKDDIIVEILRKQAVSLGYRFGGGTLECLPDGYGFLRPSGLLPSSDDIYVSSSQIRRFGLRNGDVVWGIIRPPKDQEHYEALLRVENVNFTDPEAARRRPHFEMLTPIFPNEKLNLETDRKEIATRCVDLFAPIGKGQRALLVSPPKAGKTTLLKNLANAITTNHPEVILMVLLIDERPEEVTDMARSVDGEIIASTFDRPSEEHIRVASLALDKAKRLVEVGKDVVLLLDSITRLARASNLIVPPSGRTLSGGMDPAALNFPKKFFGAARNIENGGSFTIIGTSLVETGSRMDDVIYEEFKGTGNMEVHLSRKISEQRIFPALDITKSGTRKEELLVSEDDLQRIWVLRRKIANMDETEVLNLILERLRNSATNKDFLSTIKIS